MLGLEEKKQQEIKHMVTILEQIDLPDILLLTRDANTLLLRQQEAEILNKKAGQERRQYEQRFKISMVHIRFRNSSFNSQYRSACIETNSAINEKPSAIKEIKVDMLKGK